MYREVLPKRENCGLFNFTEGSMTPAYYAFQVFNELHSLGTAVSCSTSGGGLSALAAKDASACAIMLVNSGNVNLQIKPTISGHSGEFRRYRIARGDSALAADGCWRQTQMLCIPARSVLLLTTRPMSVSAPVRAGVVKPADAPEDVYAYKHQVVREVKPTSIRTNSLGHAVVSFGTSSVGWLEMFGKGDYEIYVGEVLDSSGRVCRWRSSGKSIFRPQPFVGKATGGRYRIPMPKYKLEAKTPDPMLSLPREYGEVSDFAMVEIVRAPCGPGQLIQKAINYPMDLSKSSFTCDNPKLVRLYEASKLRLRKNSFRGVCLPEWSLDEIDEGAVYDSLMGLYAMENDFSLARKTFEWSFLRQYPFDSSPGRHSVVMAWSDWMWSGDRRSLDRFYRKLKSERIDFEYDLNSDGLLMDNGTVSAVASACRYRNLLAMTSIAKALDQATDAVMFSAEAVRVKLAFENAFFRSEQGLYAADEFSEEISVHANALAVAFNLAPNDRIGKIADYLEAHMFDDHDCPYPCLQEALLVSGRMSAVIKLMLETDRFKERTSCSNGIISRWILGVTPLEPGFSRVSVYPQIGDLNHISGVVPTVKGPVSVKIEGSRLTVDSPAPTLVVWNNKISEVGPGKHDFE